MLNIPRQFSLAHYGELIAEFAARGYSLAQFQVNSQAETGSPKLFLRHDVDVDLNAALTLARFEKLQNIQASYFFLLRGPFYNVLSEKGETIVNEIHECGHDVALHVDLSLYDGNLETAVMNEIDCLARLFPYINRNIFSVHKPATISIGQQLSIWNLENVSSETLFGRAVEYVSDSTGTWRYVHPLESSAFQTRSDMQLLTHPIWWACEGRTPREKVEASISHNQSTITDLLRRHLPKLFGADGNITG